MNNNISFNEFKAGLGSSNMTDQEMRQLFNQLDINHDGQINYDEFITGVHDKKTGNSKAGRIFQNDFIG